MISPRYARLIAEVFKRGEPRSGDMSPRSNRDEEIALIERAMETRIRRTARLRIAAGCSVAAAVALALFGTWRSTHREPVVATAVENTPAPKAIAASAEPVGIAIASGNGAIVAAPGSSAPAVAGLALRAGSRLIVDPSAGATLSLSTGTHLEVEPGSQLAVVEDSRAQIFALTAGSLRADVAKLAKDERFIVRTSDAEVEVRGTSFLVDVVPSDPECGAGTTTRVTVFEGVVTVRAGGQEEAVARGERWPRGCRTLSALAPSAHAAIRRPSKDDPHMAATGMQTASQRATAPHATTAAPASLAAVQNQSAAAPAHQASTPSRPSSTLAEENNLFADGMLARRSGNVPLAIERMERFLERYPASHLAENAAAERMRLLRALDPNRAAAAAHQYLQRYPSGFARAEADAIIGGRR
jgi:ferric-dicitrate binding protein FerR (iron transport regulator)